MALCWRAGRLRLSHFQQADFQQWLKHDGSHTLDRPLVAEVALDLSPAPRRRAERQDPDTGFANISQDQLTRGTTDSIGYLTRLLVYLVGLRDR
jgi:hypothetical protein